MLCHLATATDWAAALAAGAYRISTRGLSLEDAGFIHCARPGQLAAVADRFYRGLNDDLVVLVIDPDRTGAELRDEDTHGTGETFPHLYGPVPLDAVVAAVPYAPGPDGRFAAPDLPGVITRRPRPRPGRPPPRSSPRPAPSSTAWGRPGPGQRSRRPPG